MGGGGWEGGGLDRVVHSLAAILGQCPPVSFGGTSMASLPAPTRFFRGLEARAGGTQSCGVLRACVASSPESLRSS